MWQIMWMLSLLPNWVWHFVTISGVLALFMAFVLKAIPFVKQYRIPLQVWGVVALLGGLWVEGGLANEAKWQARVKELEAKVAVSEEKSKELRERQVII